MPPPRKGKGKFKGKGKDKKDDLAIAEPGADVTISDSGAVVLFVSTPQQAEKAASVRARRTSALAATTA